MPLNFLTGIQLQQMASNDFYKWQVVLVDLNPVKGKEMSKVIPCLIISPTAARKHLRNAIVDL